MFENISSFHLHFCELKLMDFYCIPVVTIAKCFRMDEADTWLFKEEDKWVKTAFLIPQSTREHLRIPPDMRTALCS